MAAELLRQRMWLVFFTDPPVQQWWGRFFRPGYRHVSAAGWRQDEGRWVYFNPTARGINIEVWTDATFHERLAQLIRDSSVILSVKSTFERRSTPPGWYCVGAVKALLGVRSRALSPWGLCRDLLARGATIAEVPAPEVSVDTSPGIGREHLRGRQAG